MKNLAKKLFSKKNMTKRIYYKKQQKLPYQRSCSGWVTAFGGETIFGVFTFFFKEIRRKKYQSHDLRSEIPVHLTAVSRQDFRVFRASPHILQKGARRRRRRRRPSWPCPTPSQHAQEKNNPVQGDPSLRLW